MVGEPAWANVNGVWAGVVTNGTIRRGAMNCCPTTGILFYPAATLIQAHGHLLNTDTDEDGSLDDFSSLHAGGANTESLESFKQANRSRVVNSAHNQAD